MADVVISTGSIDFNGGSFTTAPLYYVLTLKDDQPSVSFGLGSAGLYVLSTVRIFGRGDLGGLGTRGWVDKIYNDALGSFDDFAIYPYDGTYLSQDPADVLVTADNSGTLTAGVGNAWSRHYRVLYPPKGTRFVVPHVSLGSIPAGVSQYLDAHQMEVLKASVNVPSTFGSARSLRVTVRPTRLNYAAGSTHVTSLVTGTSYTASADVNGRRVVQTFTAIASTVDLNFGGAASRILVEEGTVAGDYFDGSFGPDYLWEQGSTPGLGRSYYYQDRLKRHYILMRTLQENIALGVRIENPQYAILPAPTTDNSGITRVLKTDPSSQPSIVGYGTSAYGFGSYGAT